MPRIRELPKSQKPVKMEWYDSCRSLDTVRPHAKSHIAMPKGRNTRMAQREARMDSRNDTEVNKTSGQMKKTAKF